MLVLTADGWMLRAIADAKLIGTALERRGG